MKKKVMILGGGISKERLISLETAKSVFNDLYENASSCRNLIINCIFWQVDNISIVS